ncbi:S-adenosyl-L-methionine-dependent methyltransferase [Coniophora puteana RWD-64-598 SS2]|uniref:S-adenosyl-L-methionine-dependent methyltransferase n=1 Tax=Coniophora puteana (strain RWD-64-598) TaxID=741705 RepID=A0A5M3N171_CONPW|nr:S-adenosyl-L-methionine-dependent methyltransferase [Coniophora puteana RWD-64-598 SS2]EIW85150.1 S-adenosyl-L-methionine-dependent methyltransferase [Coniophora puteana RWD-64-598 SS2]
MALAMQIRAYLFARPSFLQHFVYRAPLSYRGMSSKGSITVHQLAQTGFGKGTNELYDRARPSYPLESLTHIRGVSNAPSINIVEIGSGTGIFTRALLAHPSWTTSISELRAIEPSDGMREVFSKTVTDSRVIVQNGTFDTTGVEDSWADLIVIAQAFHWCPDYDKAAAEFARILKKGGAACMIWNLEDRDGARWCAQLRERIEQHEAGSPQFRLGLWRKLFDTPSYGASFQPPEEKQWEYHLEGSLDICTNRAQSKSYIAVLPPDEKQRVVDDIVAILNRGNDKKWIDEEKGIFEYPYKTYLAVCRKKD